MKNTYTQHRSRYNLQYPKSKYAYVVSIKKRNLLKFEMKTLNCHAFLLWFTRTWFISIVRFGVPKIQAKTSTTVSQTTFWHANSFCIKNNWLYKFKKLINSHLSMWRYWKVHNLRQYKHFRNAELAFWSNI